MSAAPPIRLPAISRFRSILLALVLAAWTPGLGRAEAAGAKEERGAHLRGVSGAPTAVPETIGGSLQIAVASNFVRPLRELARVFEAESGVQVRISSGSTGSLYAQIRNGAPYDLFLAADAWRPQLLAKADLIVPGTRQTYAVGRLVLAAGAGVAAPTEPGACERVYRSSVIRRVAIANPRTAPYGRAARETLELAGDWQPLQDRLVFGSNVTQTFQFLATRNVDAAFISASQLRSGPGKKTWGCLWEVPTDRHAPIIQQFVRLRRGANPAAAERFERFLTSAATRSKLAALGYRDPELND